LPFYNFGVQESVILLAVSPVLLGPIKLGAVAGRIAG